MRLYDIVALVTPDLADEDAQKVTSEYRKLLTDGGGEIVKDEPWGRRRLAYTIGRHKEGIYVLEVIKGDGALEYGSVAKLIDTATGAGASRVALLSERTMQGR